MRAAPELAGDETGELVAGQAGERGLQHRALLQGATVGQRQLAQLRVVLEEQALQLRQALILPRHHRRIRQRLAAVVVYGEVLVELE